MNRTAIRRMIFDRAVADTGTGGLYHASAPLIKGLYWDQFPSVADYPYVVAVILADEETGSFGKDGYDLDIAFNIYVNKSAQSVDNADLIADRLRTVYQRWIGTTPTGSGSVVTTMQRTGGRTADDLNIIQRTEVYAIGVNQE